MAKIIITIVVQLLLVLVLSQDSDIESDKSRKHYGMSYHVRCDNYVKSFTCMTACKSIGFQVFRMDQRCKCSCHELKTTTVLPFFKWLTNGTTQQWHKTQSVPLYNIVGTLSPPTYIDYAETDNANITVAPDQDKGTGNTDDGNSTASNGGTDGSATGEGGDAEGEAEGGAGNGGGGGGNAPAPEGDAEAEPEGEGGNDAEPEA